MSKLKSWDGVLSDLSQEELELFKFAYDRYYLGHSFEIITTKKQIKEIVKNWKQGNWPKKVVNRMEFMLYHKLQEDKKAQKKLERKQLQKLKRKYENS